MSLLSKAKKVEHRGTYKKHSSDERSEIALAWLKDEITLKQISIAMGHKESSSTSAYLLISTGLRDSYRMGILKIKNK